MTVTDTGAELDPTADEFFTADAPDGLEPAAADGPPPDDPDHAPYGWTRDRETHDWRPKKTPGRPRATPPPSAEDVAAAPVIEHPEDTPPPPRGRKRRSPPPTDATVPMPKGGVIARGVDRLYRRAGRMIRILDDEIGLAVIECSRPDPEDPDAPTAGQAWEALARDNPRVRAWLLGLLKGGTWQDLIMVHAPIALALFTRDWVRRLIPGAVLERAAESMLVPDPEDAGPDDLRPEDVGDMQRAAEAHAQRIAAKMGVKVPPNVAAAAMAQAERMQQAREAPEAFRRQQPAKGGSRAKRRAGR
jgi:hypothetical protein